VVGIWIHLGDQDLRVVRDLHPLVVVQKLFVQLFPFTESGKLDFNVLPYFFTGNKKIRLTADLELFF
jgi:hypothetical protein